MKGTQSKRTQIMSLSHQNPHIVEIGQLLEWRLCIVNQSRRFSDAVFVKDTLKVDIAVSSIKNGTVLLLLGSFGAVFVKDTLNAVFTATNTKNGIGLSFLSTFILRRTVVRGSKLKEDYENISNL
jgi:hypothetical protein